MIHITIYTVTFSLEAQELVLDGDGDAVGAAVIVIA
jgi:hypothetical protein